MKHLLRRGKKKFDLPFSCAISSEKRKEEKINSTEADLYTRRTMWSIKGKSGNRWDLANIKRQNFFFKMQGIDETTKNM